jgi:hypothetical protein
MPRSFMAAKVSEYGLAIIEYSILLMMRTRKQRSSLLLIEKSFIGDYRCGPLPCQYLTPMVSAMAVEENEGETATGGQSR